MLTPIEFEIGGEKYQALPHTGFEALNLDRKVTALFSKVLQSGAKSDGEFYAAVTGAFSDYSDAEYRWLVETTFNRCTVVTDGKQHARLADMDAIAGHFRGKGSELYAAMLNIWRLEKLSPFEHAPEAATDGG